MQHYIIEILIKVFVNLTYYINGNSFHAILIRDLCGFYLPVGLKYPIPAVKKQPVSRASGLPERPHLYSLAYYGALSQLSSVYAGHDGDHLRAGL